MSTDLASKSVSTGETRCAKLLVLIVSYGNPDDVQRCLSSLEASDWDDFEILICENAGSAAFAALVSCLTGHDGILDRRAPASHRLDHPGARIVDVVTSTYPGRPVTVRLGEAQENLGYGGGVNAWLERAIECPGWSAALVLNPDTEVDTACLSELMAKSIEGYGMVGGTLVFDHEPRKVINYGLIWSPITGRIIAAGRNAVAGSEPTPDLLAKLDAISGACVLVTRDFVRDVGLMSEDYFLYMEDLDWGLRRGKQQIGFAARAIVKHVCGTSIGSAVDPGRQSRLSSYLSARNTVLYARRRAGWLWPIHLGTGLVHAARQAIHGNRSAAQTTLNGLIDGVRLKAGRPSAPI